MSGASGRLPPELLVEQLRARVRARPEARITLEDAAAEAGLSPVRLHQVFSDQHQENFGAFVRRVRLEYAIGLMRAFPDRSCTAIAHEAGFSESSDFTRTFKRAYGVAPSRWDRIRPLAVVQLESQARDDEAVTGSAYGASPDAARSPVTVRPIPSRRVAVVSVPGAAQIDALASAFDRLEAWALQHGELEDGRRFMGLSQDSDLDTPADVYRFELAYEVGPHARSGGGVIVRELPGCHAAVLACRGGMTEFIAAWDHLQRGFLPNSGWAPAPAPQMEIYYADPRKTGMQYWDMDCVLPVHKEGDDHA